MKNIETIYDEMRESFAAAAGFTPADSCDSAVRLYSLAAQISSLLVQADWVLAQSFPQTAQGEYLDYHAFARALERGAAVRAEGVIRFGGTAAGQRVIPAGTVCMSEDGARFETTEDAVIEAGREWVDVPARAVEPGAAGNVIAGRIRFIGAMPAGVSACTNPAAFTGGTDAEDDESLRKRILDSYRRLPNGANAAYYEQEAVAAGAAAAKAVGRSRGIGTVDVYVTSQEGAPSAALLAAVRERLAEKREIAVDVAVKAPAAVTVAVRAKIACAAGADFDKVCERAEQVLHDHFTGALLGNNVKTAELYALLFNVEGVENVHLLAPTADVAVSSTALALLGNVELTAM